ncbi:CoA ester lyase [Acuticoccus sp. M5D2P5]|uniref:HpcH/HpaI aldolase/citrate lyase family protein n=1 Tax=Acuticoccus kalidii TaxID=2910977 RepID=UPI001F39CFE7|nr:CoA ester lyase [Acuticoccus kalidii]MCF3933147.1 CoA ester lyase [Acuticoccus kalidii]
MRSLLFVPGDSERKLAKGFEAGADRLILDLEDSVAPERKAAARTLTADAVRSAPVPVAVRVNALSSGLIEDDLAAIMPAGPAMIVLPKSDTGADVQHLSALLTVLEAENGLADGGTEILAIATETAASLFGLGTYRGSSARLAAMAWGAEDLSSALGATRTREADGTLTDPYRLARTLCLAGAVAAGAAPIDTVYTDFRDEAGLIATAKAAAADGFLGKLAIHPAQVGPINAAFTPSPEAIAHAQRVVDAFAAAPGAGVVGLDGAMLDRPHLVLAEQLLARAAAVRPPSA